MNIVFLDAGTVGEDISLAPIADSGALTVYQSTAPSEIPSRIRDAEVVVINKVKLNSEYLAGASHLRLICVAATGYDNVDLAYCRSRGIGLANVVGYSTESVVLVTFALALNLATRLPTYTDFVASGEYTKSKFCNLISPTFYDLAGKTWGIVGYGHIGARVAEVARAFGCRVLAYSRTPKEGVENRTLEDLLRESDFVSLHVPLTDETRGLIGTKELGLMKDGAVLLNLARGAVVDEKAVAERVLDGKLLFGCDVYSQEPPSEIHPYAALYGHPGVCLTPHMAWGSFEARERCIAEIALNIQAYERGERRNRLD